MPRSTARSTTVGPIAGHSSFPPSAPAAIDRIAAEAEPPAIELSDVRETNAPDVAEILTPDEVMPLVAELSAGPRHSPDFADAEEHAFAAHPAMHVPPSPGAIDEGGEVAALGAWDEPSIEEAFQATIGAHGLKLGQLAQPVRVAMTGGTVSPGIYEVLAVLGRERSLARLRRAITRLARA